MGFREGLGNLTQKFAKYIAIGAVVSGGGGIIKQSMAQNTLDNIAEDQKIGNMVEDAGTKQAKAVQEITESQTLQNYGSNMLGNAFVLGIVGGMIAGTKKKEGEEPEARSRGLSPTT